MTAAWQAPPSTIGVEFWPIQKLHAAPGLALELVLLLPIIYTPWGHALFGTAPPGLGVWLLLGPLALLMGLLEETRNALIHRHTKRKAVSASRAS